MNCQNRHTPYLRKKNKLQRARRRAFLNQNGCCCYCNLQMWQFDPDELTVLSPVSKRMTKALKCTAEHLKSRSEGGSNENWNIAAACLRCNKGRHALKKPLSPDAFRKYVLERIRGKRWHNKELLERLPKSRLSIN